MSQENAAFGTSLVPFGGAAAEPSESLLKLAMRVGSARVQRSHSLMDAIDHHAAGLRTDPELEVLDIGAEPHQEMRVWGEYFSESSVHGIHFTDGGTVAPEISDAQADGQFGSEFWVDMARKHSPGIVLGDGQMSYHHQFELFIHLFPILRPGGFIVLEHQGAEASMHAGPENVLHALLQEVMNEGFASASSLTVREDFIGYCARNVVAVEFSERAVIVRKRNFEQRKLRAVPLSDIAENCQTMDQPAAYPRIAPQVHGSERIRLRTEDLFEAVKDIVPPTAQVAKLRNVTVLDGGIVVTDDDRIVDESFINARHASKRGSFFRVGDSDLYVSERSLAPAAEFTGHDYVIVKQTWDRNYGHWIVDTLPRIGNLETDFDLSSMRFILNGGVPDHIRSLHADGLKLFGVDKDRLEHTYGEPTFVARAVYATPMSVPPYIKAPRAIRILESLVGRCDAGTRAKYANVRKIYLSRNEYPRRNLINEQEIWPLLEQAGYEFILPEKLSFEEQICLFASATHVVGNMGAAFSSLAFSPAGVKVFVLATEIMVHDFFYDLVCHKNGTYVALQGTATDKKPEIGSDFSVDAVQFQTLLADFDN